MPGGYAHTEGKFSMSTISRRAILAGVAPATIGVAAIGAAPAEAALPVVYMDRMVVQSQVEPWTNRNSGLPGDDGVKEIQKALRAKFGGVTVDGQFGDQTRAAYARWQRALGYTGNAANGIIGPSSLTRLGSGRFSVARKIDVGGHVSYSGVTLNARTRAMLVAADAKVSWSLDATKGSFVGCDGNSACTHAVGGAVDVVIPWSGTRHWQTVRALRQVGFAAWYRPTIPGVWTRHIHAIAIGDTDTHIQAADQVGDYYLGRSGLSGHAADNTPAAYRVGFTWWEAYRRGSR